MDEREYTITKKVSKKYFLEELEYNIYYHGDKHGFLSYKAVSVFEEYFWRLLDELESAKDIMDPQEYSEICQAFIERLENIETDDDWFPENDIDLIQKMMA